MRTMTSFGVALVLLGTGITTIHSASAADWKPSRNVEFIIPYGPGGGFDTIVRKLSPYIEKELGGKVLVIPKNVPGGSGSKAAINLKNARPNGSKIMIFNIPGHAMPNIKGQTKRYDLTKFTWLARIAKGNYVVVVSGKSGINSFQDLLDLKRPVKNPELGSGGTSFMTSTIMWSTFGKDVKFITGYKSSSAYALAVIRGDGDTTMLAAGSFRKYIGGGMKKKKIGPQDL
ncbi:MAG: tripartite-type tricarboxylate transporter receptor subunit TctC, partial [Alphaproteobacteria bacterium]